MSLQDWDTIFGIAQNIFTISAIIVGAIWTYFHYFHGRTYRPRLETSISGRIVKQDGALFLVAELTLKNVGLSKIDLTQKGSGLRIIGIENIANVSKIKKYEGIRLKTVPIFVHHAYIEPGETIVDVQSYLLPKNIYCGIKLDGRLIARKIAWRFSSVVTISENSLPTYKE